MARLLAERGAAGVTVCGRNEDRGGAVAYALEEVGCPALFVQADLLREEDSQHRPGTVPPFASWTERDDPGVGVLHARKLDGNLFLCSTDGSVRFNVSPTEARPFDRLANDHRMAFTQDGSTWRLTPRDPRLS